MTVSKASGSNSTAYTTASSSKRLSGLISGLDTDSIVAQLTSGTQSKIDKQMQSKQLAQWQQSSYREVVKALSEFKTKYFASATSSSSILNTAYFNSNTIKNTSSLVNVSGSTAAAQNMVISKITQLAKQASFSSTHKVSNEAITTGAINDTWTKSMIASGSVTINYGGNDYKLTLDDNFSVNPTNNPTDATTINSVITQLQKQINQNADLKDKITFTYDSTTSKVSLTDVDGKSLKITTGSTALLSGLGLTDVSNTTNGVVGTAQVDTGYFNNHSITSGSNVEFNINGNSYTLNFSNDFALSSSPTQDEVTTAIQKAISSNKDLAGKLQYNATDGFTSSSTMKITGGSQNLINGLGLTSNGDGTYTTSGTYNKDALLKSYLQDSLSGTTLTFSLDGLNKSITFDESDKANYSTLGDSSKGLVKYLQDKLNSTYGSGKITVNSKDGGLSFSTTDSTSVITITSSSKSGVLGMNSALNVYAGTSNRLNTNMALEDLANTTSSGLPQYLNQSTPNLKKQDQYKITVNGTDFTFDSTASVNSIINEINNNASANVTISYSSTTDTFSAVAKDGGSSGKVDISDISGNLASTLFGKAVTTQTINTTDTLSTIASIEPFSTNTADSNYSIKVNGTILTFSPDTTLDSVLKGINDNGVAISYNKNTNSFNISDTDKAKLSDVNGSTLFSQLLNKTSDGDYTVQTGQDAKMTISFDGGNSYQDITRSDNSFTLDGVNFDLLGTNIKLNADGSVDTSYTPDPIKFTTQNNTDDLLKKIKDFVTDYNNIVTLAYGKVIESKKTDNETYAPLTDAQKKEMSETQITAWETKAKKGILQNDSLLYDLTNNMRSSMTDQVSSIKTSLYELGITTKSDDYATTNGQLTIDDDKLKTALTNDPDKVAALFTSSDGIATKLQKVIDTNINTSSADPGILIQKAGYDGSTVDNSLIAKSITDYNDQIKALKTRLEDQQEYYYNKFTRLEQYMSQMNSQSSYFTQNSSNS